MTSPTLHPLAAAYLTRLRTASRDLPSPRRDELVAEIEDHLAEVIPPDATDAQALTELDRLGEPAEIVEAEQPEAEWPAPAAAPARPATTEPPPRRGAQEWAAIVLLLVGGLALGVGWFIGVLMLWTSRAWTLRDKLIGTLIVPGGLALTWVLIVLPVMISPTKCGSTDPGHDTCDHGSTLIHVLYRVLLAVAVIAPFVTATYLAVRAGRAERAARIAAAAPAAD